MEAAGEEEEEEGAAVVEEEEVGVEEVAVEEAVEEADGVQEVVTGEWKCVDLVSSYQTRFARVITAIITLASLEQ